MYDVVFENLRKSTESAIQVQQEMFRTWGNFWGGAGLRRSSPFRKSGPTPSGICSGSRRRRWKPSITAG